MKYTRVKVEDLKVGQLMRIPRGTATVSVVPTADKDGSFTFRRHGSLQHGIIERGRMADVVVEVSGRENPDEQIPDTNYFRTGEGNNNNPEPDANSETGESTEKQDSENVGNSNSNGIQTETSNTESGTGTKTEPEKTNAEKETTAKVVGGPMAGAGAPGVDDGKDGNGENPVKPATTSATGKPRFQQTLSKK